MTTPQSAPAAPSPALLVQTAQALSITADPPEPWASLDAGRRYYWIVAAAIEHGVVTHAVGDRVQVTRGVWASMTGRVLEVVLDAACDPFYRVGIGHGVDPLFLHQSELAPFAEGIS